MWKNISTWFAEQKRTYIADCWVCGRKLRIRDILKKTPHLSRGTQMNLSCNCPACGKSHIFAQPITIERRDL